MVAMDKKPRCRRCCCGCCSSSEHTTSSAEGASSSHSSNIPLACNSQRCGMPCALPRCDYTSKPNNHKKPCNTSRRRRTRRCGVHHGVPQLRAALLKHTLIRQCVPRASPTSTCTFERTKTPPDQFPSPRQPHCGSLSALHEALLLDALAFASALDLARLETTCRSARQPHAAFSGRSVCEHVAWLQLELHARSLCHGRTNAARAFQQRLLADQATGGQSPRGSMLRLHLATSRVLLTVLRRRSGHTRAREHLATICGAAAMARDLMAPMLRAESESSTHSIPISSVSSSSGSLHVMSELDIASGVAVSDGVFAEASLFEHEERDIERVDVPFECAMALGLAVRTVDSALAVGDCVVDAVPESLRSKSRLEANGCWVIRRVNGGACWSPEAYKRHLDAIRVGERAACDIRKLRCRKKPCVDHMHFFDRSNQDWESLKGQQHPLPHPIQVGPEAKAQIRERLAMEIAASQHAESCVHRAKKRRQADVPETLPTVHLEFEHAYDRQDLALPLNASAATAVDLARLAFDISGDRRNTVLFATGAKSGRTACWTYADNRTTLAEYGLHAGDHVAFLLCVLPDMRTGFDI